MYKNGNNGERKDDKDGTRERIGMRVMTMVNEDGTSMRELSLGRKSKMVGMGLGGWEYRSSQVDDDWVRKRRRTKIIRIA